MLTKLNHVLLAGVVALACSSCQTEKKADYQVIPLPQEVVLTQEKPFLLNKNVSITYPEGNLLLKRNAEFLSGYIRQATGYTPPVKGLKDGETAKHAINLGLDADIANKEGYVLTTTSEGIQINGQTENGVFYGCQTLRKSIPAEAQGADILLPAGSIKDEPRFTYRGMHLDVCRHFFPLEFIKEYIDLLALHNMNTFHWHLTDDQGWRIEIKKYPKLTEVGSKRNCTVVGKARSGKYDNIPYGGFYTQEQAKEIVKYAQERYITVIPEVDLPGHMLAALAAYPDMGCTGGPYKVSPDWGIFEDVLCIGNEQSMQFLEDVMAEITEIFPSKLVHIGGDEAPRTRWAKCPKCQARIKAEGLKTDKQHTAEDRLQSYCMTRIEKFLNSKGRQIIGWDEILEGDVAPNATVMSWRGVEGGLNAAKAGHNAIMTPNPYAYLDQYQEEPEIAPVTIGGYNTLKKTYSYNPVPDDANELVKKHIIGVQGNIWTEYMPGNDNRDYQAFPRAVAIAETGWTLNANKNWNNFCQRMVEDFRRMDVKNVKACRNFFDVNINTHVDETNTLKVVLESFYPNAEIHYTTNGSVPTVESAIYNQPFALSGEMDVKAAAFKDGKMLGKVSGKKLYGNLISGKSFTVTPPIGGAKGDIFGENDVLGTDISTFGLTNGKRGNIASMTPWSGFRMNDACNKLVFIVEFEQPTTVSKVVFGSLYNPASVILPPSVATVETSSDGRKYDKMAEASFKRNYPERGRKAFTDTLGFAPKEVKYIKITLQNGGTLRNGIDFVKDPNEKDVVQANIYLDEIEVY